MLQENLNYKRATLRELLKMYEAELEFANPKDWQYKVNKERLKRIRLMMSEIMLGIERRA